MAIDLANVVDTFDDNANRQWRTDSHALYDDRRIPILRIMTTGLKYDCFSAFRTDREDYNPNGTADYRRMRDVTDLHPDASCRDPDYEHYWLYPDCAEEKNAEVVIQPALRAVLGTECNADAGK